MRSILAASFIVFVAGCGVPSFLVTPVQNTNALQEIAVPTDGASGSSKIAILEVEGMLVNSKSGGLLQPTENSVSLFVQQLRAAADDSKVKAVVLRVNSPGGTVTASDTMYEELLRFKAKTHKPVVASTQEVAASGAYYICCAADKIVAHPTSVVGSIGVIFSTFNFEGTLAKLGATSDAVKSAPLKDMGSPFRTRTAEETAIMQSMVDEYFLRFEGVVASHRPVKEQPPAIPVERTYRGIYSGRVYSGARAVELGLADQTGLLEDAIALARELSHSPTARVIQYKRPFGYRGSIYASEDVPPPQANSFNVNIPSLKDVLPTGFYYLWQP
ncbi:MAG TPA: signal peptide peptidase SppA [Tepidisphaeraceae bacterium]